MADTNVLGTSTVTQVALVVHDIAKTAERFAKLLGVPVPPVMVTSGREEAHTLLRGQPSDARAKLAFFNLGQVSLELIEPDGEPSTWREHLDAHGESVHHIAFLVNDIPAKCAALEELGMPTVQSGDYTGGRYAYIGSKDALGVELELLENLS